MPPLLTKIIKRIGPGGPPRVLLGAFGKHPAWADHIHPPIGLDGRLQAVWETLYLQGVARALPAWDAARPGALIPFGHLLIWPTRDDVVVGRLWESADAAPVPRRQHPMAVVALCTGASTAWAIDTVGPRLARLEEECKAAATREAVVAALDAARADLAALAAAAFDPDRGAAGAGSVAALADRVGEAGVLRVLYALEGAGPDRAKTARAPRGVPAADAALAWADLLEARFGGATERLLMLPDAGGWVDLVLGPVGPPHVRALRLAAAALPLDSDAPYNIDAPFARDATAFLARCRADARGPVPAGSPPPAAAPRPGVAPIPPPPPGYIQRPARLSAVTYAMIVLALGLVVAIVVLVIVKRSG